MAKKKQQQNTITMSLAQLKNIYEHAINCRDNEWGDEFPSDNEEHEIILTQVEAGEPIEANFSIKYYGYFQDSEEF